jgi:hypothetical protein
MHTYTNSLQPTILNQFKVGLETDEGHFTLNVKTVMLMSHFFAPNSTVRDTKFRATSILPFATILIDMRLT